MDFEHLTGRSDEHLTRHKQTGLLVHPEAAEALFQLQLAASKEDIDLRPCSIFRSFDQQLKIWSAKCEGTRKVLGFDEQELDHGSLSDDELLEAILRWSMIPGSSRHHWGTDLDVFDAAAVPRDYDLRLEAYEYASDGVFSRLTAWLDENMSSFGFYRPYGADRGGVGIEPWHLSYAPISTVLLEQYSLEVFERNLREGGFRFSNEILDRSSAFFERYVVNVETFS